MGYRPADGAEAGEGGCDFLRGTRYYVGMRREAGLAPARQRVSHPDECILRRRIMNKRLVWLAPVALAVLLSGCQVTVTTLGSLALDSLVGYKLTLTNDERGGPLDTHDASVIAFPVENEITYYFLDANEVRDFDLDVTTSDWTYKSSGNRGTLEIGFFYNERSDLIIDCELTFKRDRFSGTHRCEFEQKGNERVVVKETVRSGWGEDTFELEDL